MKTYNKKRGFTLVELIVVIAIVAILAAVSIVGFSRYIENARMSNDNQAAEQMTDVIRYYITLNNDDDLDANDVRTIVNANSDTSFDFNPQSRNSVFMYLEDTKTVIVASEQDLFAGAVQLYSNGTYLLSDPNESHLRTPEEVFGHGTYVLSTEGSLLADVISGVRALTQTSSIENDFSSLEDLAQGTSSLESLLLDFNPDNTLFVNDRNWVNAPSSNTSPYKRVLFMNDIRNIPQMRGVPTATLFTIESSIRVPRSVSSIEKESFSRFILRPGETFNILGTNLVVENGAFASWQKSTYDISVSEQEFPTLNVVAEYYDNGWISFSPIQDLTDTTRVRFNITGIPRSEVDNIVVQRVQEVSGLSTTTLFIVKAYSNESGLLGVKTLQVNYI